MSTQTIERHSTHHPEPDELRDLEIAWLLPAAAEMAPLPRALRVEDLPEYAEARADHAEGLGSLAVGQCAERPPEDRKTSILVNLERAAAGDRAALGEDALLALVEAVLEEGVNEIELEVNEHGEFTQNGNRIYDIVADAIRFHPGDHPGLHETTRREGLNVSIMHMLLKRGYFAKGYIWFVPRMVARGVPAASAWRYGHFKNIAVAGNLIWQRPDGKFMSRSLFMAGAPIAEDDESATEAMKREQLYALMESRLSRRHDITAVGGIWQAHGLAAPEGPDDVHEFQKGALFHRNSFEHPDEPDIDVARWYDAMLGPGHFLGRAGASGDYVANSRKSIADMCRLGEQKELLVDEMIAHYRERGSQMTGVDAARLMAKLARGHAIDYVIDNPDVDARPLGRAIVTMREEYWQQMQLGNLEDAGNIRTIIHKNALVNACGHGQDPPSAAEAKAKKDNQDPLSNSPESANRDEGCDYIHNGCYCSPYTYSGQPLLKPLFVKARKDSDGTASCLRLGCDAKLGKDGKPITKGKIWARAQALLAGGSRQEDFVLAGPGA